MSASLLPLTENTTHFYYDNEEHLEPSHYPHMEWGVHEEAIGKSHMKGDCTNHRVYQKPLTSSFPLENCRAPFDVGCHLLHVWHCVCRFSSQ